MKTPKTLFLAWQDFQSRRWFPIERLNFDGERYEFVYPQGVENAAEYGFDPLLSFPSLEQVYTSTYLFPVFANRLMPRSRPDYPDFVQWLNIPQEEEDSISILSRTEGQKKTDTLTVFPSPELDK